MLYIFLGYVLGLFTGAIGTDETLKCHRAAGVGMSIIVSIFMLLAHFRII